MALVAYLDESGPEAGSFILAGYLATPEQWENFRQEWDNHLIGPPYWHYLKMSEIVSSKSSLDMERASWMYRIIERNVGAAFCCAVDTRAIANLVRIYGFTEQLANPYYFALETVVDRLTSFLETVRNDDGTVRFVGPIHFIFDDRPEKKLVTKAWEVLRSNIGSSDIVNMVQFKDDKDCLPLQAADMLAYWMKKYWDKHYKLKGITRDNLFPWETKISHPMFHSEYGQQRLIRNFKKLHCQRLGDFFAPKTAFQYSYTLAGETIYHRRWKFGDPQIY